MIFSLSLLHSPKRLGHIYKHYLMSLCLQMASHHPVKTFLEVIPVLPSTHWTSANHSPVSDGIVPSRWSSEHSSISSCPTELSSFPLTKTHTGEERGCEGVFFFFSYSKSPDMNLPAHTGSQKYATSKTGDSQDRHHLFKLSSCYRPLWIQPFLSLCLFPPLQNPISSPPPSSLPN